MGRATKNKAPNSGVDPLLKKLNSEQVLQLYLRRAETKELLIKVGGSCAVVVLLAAPLTLAWLISREFAGEDTKVNIAVTVTVTIALSLAVTGLAAWVKGRGVAIKRLKKRTDMLKRGVFDLRARLKADGIDATLPADIENELNRS